MTLSLLLYWLLDRPPARRPAVEAIVAGLMAAALTLTRSFFLPVVMAVDALALFMRRRSWRQAAVLLVIALGLPFAGTVAPHMALYQQPPEYGLIHDPFLDTDSYARWNANVEKFRLGRPLPHPELFPTRAEYERFGPYFGPRLTSAQYLFELHTPVELVTFSLAGFVDVVVGTAGFLRLSPQALVGDPAVVGRVPAFGAGLVVDLAVMVLGVVARLRDAPVQAR